MAPLSTTHTSHKAAPICAAAAAGKFRSIRSRKLAGEILAPTTDSSSPFITPKLGMPLSASKFYKPFAVLQTLPDPRPICFNRFQQGRIAAVSDTDPHQLRPASTDQPHKIIVTAHDDSGFAHRLRPNGMIRRSGHAELAHMNGVQTLISKPARQNGRKLLVDDNPHAARMTAWSTSRAA